MICVNKSINDTTVLSLYNISQYHGFRYDMVMLWLPHFFTMEFYKDIIVK